MENAKVGIHFGCIVVFRHPAAVLGFRRAAKASAQPNLVF